MSDPISVDQGISHPFQQPDSEVDAKQFQQLRYDRLQKDEVRLLNVLSGGIIPSCRLDTYLQQDAPEFDAISYHWGGERLDQTIICNGDQNNVTRNLSDCIRRLSSNYPAPRRPIWIDAVCLNQEDEVERSLHVPQMWKIYTRAQRVLIWLGNADSDTENALNAIPELHELSENVHTLGGVQYSLISDHRFHSLKVLLERPWFRRLWTFQEVVLAQDSLILCGNASIDWPVVREFVFHMNRVGGAQLLRGETCQLHDMSNPYHFFDEVWLVATARKDMHGHTIQIPGKTNGVDLVSLLQIGQTRACTEPVDRVWALMGLMQPADRDWLMWNNLVDYSENGKRQFWTAYIHVAKLIMIGYRNLKFLSLSSPNSDIRYLPSWCPNLNSMPETHARLSTFGYHAGARDFATNPYEGATHEMQHSNSIQIQGFRIDQVARVGSVKYLPILGENGPEPCDRHIFWEKQCFSMTERLLGASSATMELYAQTLVGGFIPGRQFPPSGLQETYRSYVKLRRAAQRSDLKEYDTLNSDPHVVDYKLRMKAVCQGRRFFVTENGRIGFGHLRVLPGDELCIFHGGPTVYILREEGGPGYRYVGDAFVHGIMFGEAFNAPNRGSDKLFQLD